MSPQPGRELSQVLARVPFFRNLTAEQIGKILDLSTAGFYQPGDKIWVGDGSGSNEMYILLSGELGVTTAQGNRVATIKPVTTVGELGIITSQPRSATVEATQPSNIHVLTKPIFDDFLDNDLEVKAVIYRNVIDVLYQKLVNDNIRKRDQAPPRPPAPPQEPAAAAPKPPYTVGDLKVDDLPRRQSRRILVVDDEPEIRNILKAALADFEVSEAGNGKEALALIQAQPPDLIITDIKMPEMDGITLLNIVHGQNPNLPVLGLSGYLHADEILAYSFDGFIAKPLEVDEVLRIVDETLAGEK